MLPLDALPRTPGLGLGLGLGRRPPSTMENFAKNKFRKKQKKDGNNRDKIDFSCVGINEPAENKPCLPPRPSCSEEALSLLGRP